MQESRALHYVLRISNREKSIHFYRELLDMKVLRHEEFDAGCEATCNGPYAGRWSKTMIGYGDEDHHFVLELTYNYGVNSYKIGNDLHYIKILNKKAFDNIKTSGYAFEKSASADDEIITKSPDGYVFIIKNAAKDGNIITESAIASSDLDRSFDYWINKLGMLCKSKSDNEFSGVYGGDHSDQARLVVRKSVGAIDRGTGFGRIAFSCPYALQDVISEKMTREKETIITPLRTLDTPGKQTVRVIILADPDDHEICFVEDPGFRKLAEYDPGSNAALDKAIGEDKSDEWYAKHGAKKSA